MNRSKFESVFSEEINQYLDHMLVSGYKERSYYYLLRKFDRFCIEYEICQPIFTHQHAKEWIHRKENEASTTHYARVNGIKQFLIYLNRKGYQIFVTKDISHRESDFQPYIYNEDEISRYFHAVDTYESSWNRKNAISFQYSSVFFTAAGRGLMKRLALGNKMWTLRMVLLNFLKQRTTVSAIVLNELRELMQKYAEKCFYLLDDDQYIFTISNGKRLSGDTVYECHRLFLQKAGIPYLGGGRGPRLHDWRHTFSVRSFKQMIDSGLDMYVALPILSTYLGHKTIYATERYVRLTMSLYPYIEERFKDKINKVFGEAEKYEND